MIDTLTSGVVELAKLGLIAYLGSLVRSGFIAWLQAGQPGTRATLERTVLDAARSGQIDLCALAQKVTE